MGDREFTAEELDAALVLPPGQLRTADELVASIARRRGLRAKDVVGPGRNPPLVAARLELYRALRAQGWSYPMIGRLVGRDHTTVLIACAPEAKQAVRRARSRTSAAAVK